MLCPYTRPGRSSASADCVSWVNREKRLVVRIIISPLLAPSAPSSTFSSPENVSSLDLKTQALSQRKPWISSCGADCLCTYTPAIARLPTNASMFLRTTIAFASTACICAGNDSFVIVLVFPMSRT